VSQKADSELKNNKGATPRSIANSLKDPELQKVVISLLDGSTTSTKIVRNSEVKAERRDVKLKQQQELEQLKSDLKIALEKKGYSDLNSLYKRFD
jgi:hypothetical protein